MIPVPDAVGTEPRTSKEVRGFLFSGPAGHRIALAFFRMYAIIVELSTIMQRRTEMDYQTLNLLFRCGKAFSHEKIRMQELSDTECMICSYINSHENCSQDDVSVALKADKTTVGKALASLEKKELRHPHAGSGGQTDQAACPDRRRTQKGIEACGSA